MSRRMQEEEVSQPSLYRSHSSFLTNLQQILSRPTLQPAEPDHRGFHYFRSAGQEHTGTDDNTEVTAMKMSMNQFPTLPEITMPKQQFRLINS